MTSFFRKDTVAGFEHERILESYTTNKVVFNVKDVIHVELLGKCSRDLEAKLLALQNIDKKIVIGFALGGFCLGLSILLPLTFVATIGFAYGAYQLGLREQAQVEYQVALENLISCCKWSLIKINDAKLIENPAIKTMITGVAPLVSEVELRDCIDPKYANAYLNKVSDAKEELVVMSYKLSTEEATLYYKIYGHEQGGYLAILQGVGYAISNAYITVKDALVGSVPAAAG